MTSDSGTYRSGDSLPREWYEVKPNGKDHYWPDEGLTFLTDVSVKEFEDYLEITAAQQEGPWCGLKDARHCDIRFVKEIRFSRPDGSGLTISLGRPDDQ